jgi:hypothetical protein
MRHTLPELERMTDSTRSFWALHEISESLASIDSTLSAIRVILQSALGPHLQSARITIMPKTITVGQSATAHITAANSDGSVFPITATTALVVGAAQGTDVAIGSPTFNADGSVSIPITGVAADPSDGITATVDGISSNTDILTITAAAPATVTLTLQ